MKRTDHPDNKHYTWLQERYVICRRALAEWKASGKEVPVEVWGLGLEFEPMTYDDAVVFADEMSTLIMEFNQVLWEQFPYCRQCGGQCCAYHPTIFELDLLLLALRERELPVLPDEINATKEDCIYLTKEGCAWPPHYRPLRCWTFFCLGQDDSDRRPPKMLKLKAVMDLPKIWEALNGVLDMWLPATVHYWADADSNLPIVLVDLPEYLQGLGILPIDLDEILFDALHDVFLNPLGAAFPDIDSWSEPEDDEDY
jgi:hypothetical protein